MNTHFNVSDQELAAANGGVWGLVIEGGMVLYEIIRMGADGTWLEGEAHPPHMKRRREFEKRKNKK